MKLLLSKFLISLMVLFSASSHSQQSNQLTGKWEVVELGQQSLPKKNRPTITFLEEGKITGSTGCNKYNANLQQNAQEVEISAVISTRRACVLDSVMMQEQSFLQAIQATTQFEKTNDSQVMFYGTNKEFILRLKKLSA